MHATTNLLDLTIDDLENLDAPSISDFLFGTAVGVIIAEVGLAVVAT